MEKEKPEVFAVVWQDMYLGGLMLTLHQPDAPSTLKAAKGIRERGGVANVRAYRIIAGTDTVIDLEEQEVAHAEAIHQERTLHP